MLSGKNKWKTVHLESNDVYCQQIMIPTIPMCTQKLIIMRIGCQKKSCLSIKRANEAHKEHR